MRKVLKGYIEIAYEAFEKDSQGEPYFINYLRQTAPEELLCEIKLNVFDICMFVVNKEKTTI